MGSVSSGMKAGVMVYTLSTFSTAWRLGSTKPRDRSLLFGMVPLGIAATKSRPRHRRWASNSFNCQATALTSIPAQWAPGAFGNGCARTLLSCFATIPCHTCLTIVSLSSNALIASPNRSSLAFGPSLTLIPTLNNSRFQPDLSLDIAWTTRRSDSVQHYHPSLYYQELIGNSQVSVSQDVPICSLFP